MKVLVWHGYLLRGTGSNVYTASLAHALAGLGHDVHLLCQDREPQDLDAGTPGSVTVHNPDIDGLLPVFVYDTYEGFEVKTFAELSDAELDRYIADNVEAVGGVADEVGGFDAALVNHLVMGPVILARAGLEYAIAIHGSDLSYTVLPDLDRFGPFAREAVGPAKGILVGSSHIAVRLRQAVDAPDVLAKVRLGPPGVDTELFRPIATPARSDALRRAATVVLQADGSSAATSGGSDAAAPTSWDRDVARAAQALRWYADSDGPRVIFVGKLIVSKGVDLLLAAWPLIHARNRGARLLIVGFGEYERTLRGLWEALDRGDLDAAREIAAEGQPSEGLERGLHMLGAFLAAPPDGYVEDARDASGSVAFSGRLEHSEVAVPVSASDALVFPSTFPEAFGMVAAEAAAAGVLPVAAGHSGALEVSEALEADLEPATRDLVSFPLGDGAVGAIATRVDSWLALGDPARAAAGEALRETAERMWSWHGVARMVLAGSAGELGRLADPDWSLSPR